ncbi:glycine/sarcosine/betaine reductase selenoprotein B family protein [Polynucleobacter sp. HIN7]|uniref:glycine/sarcosine/betaine reductase selenoprotein B family protein n=1 Tax=Polynucleobacter sp. HIN7 TaxID=3047866 RepID=UPI002573F6B4|nr:glycine/sarcosine/betaine reductase selenoprotein B family protein [Polynucleobacter sp. HIN7]BEI36459.1 glycine reductase [Polynucleobacter sp. HIN7]
MPELLFAPEFDSAIPYIQRTRSYYLALGYDNPYVWAHYSNVPFTPLKKSLKASTLALITTAVPYDPSKGDQGPGAPYNAQAKFYEPYAMPSTVNPDLRIAHVGIDRKHANLSEMACWFPLNAARQAVAEQRIGNLADRFYGLPTNRSQRHTLESDAPRILQMCQADGVDVAILVPNCPICHQSISLLARFLEEAGIPTIIIGAAKDIVEFCGVPRFVFNDFPLGNAAARPQDPQSQHIIFNLALDLLEVAPGPRITVQSALRWSEDPRWKLDYMNIERLTKQEIESLRSEAEAARLAAKEIRQKTTGR